MDALCYFLILFEIPVSYQNQTPWLIENLFKFEPQDWIMTE